MTITDCEEIANRFCQYFSNVGTNLASKITPVSKSFSEYLTRVSSSSFQNFDPVQMNELDEIVKSFKDGKAPGLDNVKDGKAPGLDNILHIVPMFIIKKVL